MRSLNPLTLKLHITQNWTNIFSYHNYTKNLHEKNYLNKWINEYFNQFDLLAQKAVNNIQIFETKKILYTEISLLPEYDPLLLYYITKWNKIRTENDKEPELNIVKSKNSFDTRNNFGVEHFTFSYVNFTSADASWFFEKKIEFEEDTDPILENRRNRTYINVVLLKNSQTVKNEFLTKLFIMLHFFKSQQKLENYLSLNIEKVVKFKINNLISDYIETFNTARIHYPYIEAQKQLSLNKDRDLLIYFFKLLLLSITYLQPELLVNGLVLLLEQTRKQAQLFTFLEKIIAYYFPFETLGMILQFRGRLKRKSNMRSKNREIIVGKRPQVQTFANTLYFATKTAHTAAGVINVKLWLG